VPADRPLLTAARCRVCCKTRPMKCPVRGRQPGHRRTPALAVGASASPVGAGVPPRTRSSSAASPSCPGVLPRHSVDAPTQTRCVASHGLRFRNRLHRSRIYSRGHRRPRDQFHPRRRGRPRVLPRRARPVRGRRGWWVVDLCPSARRGGCPSIGGGWPPRALP
jgi:hypothetical protein